MIETERLLVRPWRDADRAAYHAICRDPEAMRYLGPLQSRAETDAAIDRMIASQAANGFCFWAVERREDGALLGFCGLLPAKPPIVGEIEIGWRLGSDYWGQGFAREAATACLDWAWAHLDVPSVAAITVLANRRSWGLMERLGMTRIEGGDFDHPDAPEDSPLKRHILYRIARPGWESATGKLLLQVRDRGALGGDLRLALFVERFERRIGRLQLARAGDREFVERAHRRGRFGGDAVEIGERGLRVEPRGTAHAGIMRCAHHGTRLGGSRCEGLVGSGELLGEIGDLRVERGIGRRDRRRPVGHGVAHLLDRPRRQRRKIPALRRA